MTPRRASFSEDEARAWQELARAAGDKQHEWRTPVLATVNAETVDARTVILREVDVHRRQLTFLTDERAGKVAQLQRNPLAAMVMWSANLGWQLRCRVVLSIERRALPPRLAGHGSGSRRPHKTTCGRRRRARL